MFEIAACIDGYNRANSSGEEPLPEMSEADFDEMITRHYDLANPQKV